MEIQIWTGGKIQTAAIRKYGREFVEAVISNEVQMHADDLDCFGEYAKMDSYQDYLTENQ